MSLGQKWILGIVGVFVLVGLLSWSGIITVPGVTPQSAAVSNTTGSDTGASSNSAINAFLGTIDTKIKTINTSVSALGTSPSFVQINSLVTDFQSVNTLMFNLTQQLRVRVANAGSANNAQLQAALKDLGNQLSNMSSQVSTVNTNVNSPSATTLTRQNALKQLQKAQTYLGAARADVATITQLVGVK